MTNGTQQNTLLKSKPFDPIATLIRHWLKIVLFGGVLFVLIAPSAFFLSKSHYEAGGKLRVLPVIQAFIARTEEASIASYYTRFVQTLVDRIKEPKIIEKAIDRLPPDLKKLFKPDKMPLPIAARIVGRRLEATQLRGTHLIQIKLKGSFPKGMADLINNVMEVYIDEHQKEEEGKDHRRLSYLLEEKERLESETDKQTEQLQKISEEIAASAFIVKDDQPAQFQSIYERAYRDRVEKENSLKAIISEAEALKQLSLDAHVNEKAENNTLLSQLDILAQQSLHKLRDSRVGMAKDNPGRKQVDERIREIQKYNDEQRDTIKEKTRQILYEKRNTELQERIIRAKAEFEAAKKTEEEILKERNHILTERARISPKVLIKKQTEVNLGQMRSLLNRIDRRFYELKLESKAPERITLESRATRPGAPAGNNLKKLLTLIFVFAFGSVTSVCVFFDILDNRVRKDKDIINGLGTPPHRPIPDYLLVGAKNVHFSRVILDDPSNTVSQSIHSLAIRLDKERKGHNAKVAVFTGVDSKSGVTEILLNTAHAMSKLCPKVLVIEANFANPVLRQHIKVNGGQKGLVDFLMGQAALPECIVHDKERGIDLLLAGHLPTSDELVMLDRSKIPQVLEKFKEEYEFILIDTIPMLVSDLTEFFIIQADVVPLVIQGDRSLYKHLYKAGQVLLRLEVPAIAAILNWGAPRYRTGIQKIVFKLLWPIQKRLRYILSRSLHPIPTQPYPSTEISRQSDQIAKSISKHAVANDFKQRNGSKAKISLSLFLLPTILIISAMTLLEFKGNSDSSPEHVLKYAINPPSEKPATSFQSRKTPGPLKDTPNLISHVPYSNETSLLNSVESNSEQDLMKITVETSHTSVEDIKQEPWILNQNSELYTIQLLSSVNKQLLLEFAKDHGLESNVAYYHKCHNGRDWYSLIYGLYPDWSKAMEVLKDLPPSLYESSPWVRNISSIQKSINMKGSN